MTANKKTDPKPNRLKPLPKFKPLPAGKPLAPHCVPDPPAGKFAGIPGQLTLEDMNVIELPEAG
jgi:hypothetical protein